MKAVARIIEFALGFAQLAQAATETVWVDNGIKIDAVDNSYFRLFEKD